MGFAAVFLCLASTLAFNSGDFKGLSKAWHVLIISGISMHFLLVWIRQVVIDLVSVDPTAQAQDAMDVSLCPNSFVPLRGILCRTREAPSCTATVFFLLFKMFVYSLLDHLMPLSFPGLARSFWLLHKELHVVQGAPEAEARWALDVVRFELLACSLVATYGPFRYQFPLILVVFEASNMSSNLQYFLRKGSCWL